MPTSRLTRQVLAVCGTGVLLLSAAACGSDSKDPNATGQSGENGQYGGNGTGPQNQNGGGAMPGADGKVAAVDGSTAQIQSQMSGQVAVTWTASTKFTKQVAAELADIKVGDCVMVEPTESSSGSSSSATTPPTAVTAATVRITKATNGSCTPTMRGGGGGPQDGGGPQTQQNGSGGPQMQGQGPGGAAPSGAPAQLRGFGAFGEVKSVSSTGFTVTSSVPTGQGTETTPADVSVTVSGATTYTTMATGAASDVKVGVCVRADGTTDSTGAVTAKTIAVTPPADGQCGGMVFRRDAPGADSGAGSDTTQGS